MGYCTNGFIMIGPTRITQPKQKEAIKRMKYICDLSNVVKGVVDTHEDSPAVEDFFGEDASHDLSERMSSTDAIALKAAIAYATDAMMSEDYADVLDAILGIDPKSLMNEFMSVWHGEMRDTMERPFPGDKNRKILITAERTWGGGFEEAGESGYTVDQISWFNLFPILGIE
jgi:hypothetical protein